ncbi:DUF1566 domain-containing protein [Thiothrix nivea]|uniref:TIR domain-containing protein n=1 Tax=Thiothrix nivea (strain ATCC 35100 / DSM 5205 / JP2) TaxID=870187 RepID=A0A656HH02_THINJ|nr:DUF1566 domain-containing protein [Thiothrix nivea]EIJ35707.1 protein of unknown function DUF1566 [Thiothrix nivea DSM 5205]
MPKAFISYARDGGHGENLATEIQQQLQAAGFAVFRDVTGLKPGDPWFHKLEFELETSDVMVLVLSEKVRKSKWVHNEFSMAEEIGIPVIPVLAEVIRQPLWVRHLQILDFCGARDWRVLLDAVGSPVGTLTPQPPLPVVEGEQEKVRPLSPSTSGRGVGVRENDLTGRYIIHDNGTVTDTQTGLMWKRCSEGQSGADCSGNPAEYSWNAAMSKFGEGVSFAGYNDWRMPTIEELKTLVDKSQKPTINQTAFPNTPSAWFWSASPVAYNGYGAWYVYFFDGHDGYYGKVNGGSVRLVRSGQ